MSLDNCTPFKWRAEECHWVIVLHLSGEQRTVIG